MADKEKRRGEGGNILGRVNILGRGDLEEGTWKRGLGRRGLGRGDSKG